MRLAAGILALAVMAAGAPVAARQAARFPERLEAYFAKHLRLTPAERQTLLGGGPVTRLLGGDASKEVGVFGAIWIDAPADEYVRRVNDIETFEKGGAFRVTRRISDPPLRSDFDQLVVPPDDAADLKDCRVGACEIKLSAEALQRVRREVDFSKPTAANDVNRVARHLAFELVTAYREGGNQRLAVYRDNEHPTFVAKEVETLVGSMPALEEFLPGLRDYLLGYPAVALPGAQSFLYWQEAQFGLKPTVRISHLTVHGRPDAVIVASKLLYASHYFWTALELRVLVPDPPRGRGFWFVNVNRSRSDGLSGFVGRIIRGRVRGEAEKGLQNALALTKQNLESAP
jgi:hypothetical protein